MCLSLPSSARKDFRSALLFSLPPQLAKISRTALLFSLPPQLAKISAPHYFSRRSGRFASSAARTQLFSCELFSPPSSARKDFPNRSTFLAAQSAKASFAARKVGCGSEKKTSLGLFSFLYPSFSVALKASFQAAFNSG